MRLLLLCLIFMVATSTAQQGRIADVYNSIYTEFVGAPCVRLLNNTGVIGCGYADEKVYGPLFPVESDADLEKLQAKSTPDVAFTVVMTTAHFKKDVLDKLRDQGRLAGVLLVKESPPSGGFSPDFKTPQQAESLRPGSTFEWNPQGSGMSYESYDFPIFGLNDTESEAFLKAAKENVAGEFKYPRWAVELNSWMYATDNSEVCLRRGFCQPVGGQSVWASLGPAPSVSEDIVLAAAALDTNAFFHDLTPGASADTSGVITLLGAAHAIQSALNNETLTLTKTLVTAFFNAEAWGYAGSSRFVKDIASFSCDTVDKDNDNRCDEPRQYDLTFTNLRLDKVSAAIDLRQVDAGDGDSLYVHFQRDTTHADTLVDAVVAGAEESRLVGGLPVARATAPESAGLPPSSLVPFLRHRPDLPAVVLADHAAAFRNKHYHSRFDRTVNGTALCRAATTVARVLAQLANPDTPVPVSLRADCDVVLQLADCLVGDFDCDLVDAILPDLAGRLGATQPRYAGVFFSPYSQRVTIPVKFVRDFLASMTATHVEGECSSNDDCDKDSTCVAQQCVTSASHYHNAYSTGLEYDGGWKIVDASQPVWTEANWQATGLRLYLEDNPAIEAAVLAAGILLLLLSSAAGYFLRRTYMLNYKID